MLGKCVTAQPWFALLQQLPEGDPGLRSRITLCFTSGGAMMQTLIEAYLNLIVSNLALTVGLAR
jgi:hypothetical protein